MNSLAPHTDQRPREVYLIIALLIIEIVAVGAIATSMVVGAHDAGFGITPATLILVFAFLLIAATIALGGKGLYHGRLFSRALILVWQIFAVIIGTQIAIGGQPMIGIPTIALAGGTIVLLFSSPVLTYLRSHYEAQEAHRLQGSGKQ